MSSTPCFRARRRVARASAPAIRTRGWPPAATSSAARLTSHWGIDPPMPEQRASAPLAPSPTGELGGRVAVAQGQASGP